VLAGYNRSSAFLAKRTFPFFALISKATEAVVSQDKGAACAMFGVLAPQKTKRKKIFFTRLFSGDNMLNNNFLKLKTSNQTDIFSCTDEDIIFSKKRQHDQYGLLADLSKKGTRHDGSSSLCTRGK
jgi:hypothetical protein